MLGYANPVGSRYCVLWSVARKKSENKARLTATLEWKETNSNLFSHKLNHTRCKLSVCDWRGKRL